MNFWFPKKYLVCDPIDGYALACDMMASFAHLLAESAGIDIRASQVTPEGLLALEDKKKCRIFLFNRIT